MGFLGLPEVLGGKSPARQKSLWVNVQGAKVHQEAKVQWAKHWFEAWYVSLRYIELHCELSEYTWRRLGVYVYVYNAYCSLGVKFTFVLNILSI